MKNNQKRSQMKSTIKMGRRWMYLFTRYVTSKRRYKSGRPSLNLYTQVVYFSIQRISLIVQILDTI